MMTPLVFPHAPLRFDRLFSRLSDGRPPGAVRLVLRTLGALALAVVLAVALAGCASGDGGEAASEASAANATASDTAAAGAGADGAGAAPVNALTEAERRRGWTLLFDGSSFEGWRGLGRDSIPRGHWVIEDGTIRKVESGQVPTAPDGQPLEGGDIMTEKTYRNFELVLDWKVSRGGNSGIKYNVSESLSTANEPVHAALGFEYQILDDERHPDGEDPTHRAGGLYDMIAPDTTRKQVNPPGEWNRARLVFQGNHGEHWLNGQKLLEYDLGSPRMDSLLAASKYASIENFATRRAGHIVLQDHGDDVWYRTIKIRELPSR